MKTLFTLLPAAATAVAVTLPVFAGQDQQALDNARAKLRAEQIQLDKRTPAEKCDAKYLAAYRELPLDHGPRAQTTPYLNQQRKATLAAQFRTCREEAFKGSAR